MDNIELKFTDEALTAIANKAIDRKTGARGLRTIIDDVLLTYEFTLPDDETVESLTITKEAVEDNAKAIVRYKEEDTVIAE
jgi:ATP-dependent Clp protease ATP-binding subunit ClpX